MFVTVAASTSGWPGSASGRAAYSKDGVKWHLTKMPSSDDWNDVCYGNGKFVTVASIYGYNNTNTAAYSEDGIKWKVASQQGANWYQICYSGD